MSGIERSPNWTSISSLLYFYNEILEMSSIYSFTVYLYRLQSSKMSFDLMVGESETPISHPNLQIIMLKYDVR